MSKSQKSNPVSYKLAPATTLRDLYRRVTQIRQIFSNYRKQARAAYVFRREAIKEETTAKFFHVPQFYDEKLKAAYELWDIAAAKLESMFAHNESKISVNIQRLLSNDDWSEADRVGTFNGNLQNYNSYIRVTRFNMECGLDSFQQSAYHKLRVKSAQKKSDGAIGSMAVRRATMKFDVFRELRQRYPHITTKNKPRLIRLYSAWYEASGRFPTASDIRPTHLLDAGIPAAEIVGPWFVKSKTVKGPMDWIRSVHVWNQYNTRSPLLGSWLAGIGLDEHDRGLADSVSLYYRNHKATPSVEWTRQRNNELEEERREKEIEGQVPDVASWLNCSAHWRANKQVRVPKLPDATWGVVEKQDAKILCERAKRDGLCLIDTLVGFIEGDHYAEQDSDEEMPDDPVFARSASEGVCTLVASNDPKRRTIVGLNEDGICTDKHHCTGKDNEVDMEAWEYFKG